MSRPLSTATLRSLAWATAVLTSVAACRDTPVNTATVDAGPLIADSAGVRLISDSASAWGTEQRWTVASEPTLDLGEPQHPFVGVAPVVRLSDGRIAVADGSQQTIQYFDSTGKLLLSVGGRGGEEGQFHALGWIGRGAADTLVAYDFVARRLTLFDARGKLVRTALLVPADPAALAEPLATFQDGSVLVRLTRSMNPFPGKAGQVVRDSASYMRFGLDGTPVASFGKFPQGEVFGVQVRAEGPPSPFPVPFGLMTVAALRADTMLIGTGTSFEVAAFGPDGTPVGGLQAAIPRDEVTRADAKEFTAAAITRLKTGAKTLNTTLDSSLVRALENAPFPARKPAFGRMLVDATGALWLSAPLNPPASASSWTVFAPDGTWLGTVTTPEGLRVDEIGVDYVLGMYRQRHGQERVRSYPLTRGAAN
ncbi:MAG: hypothetical protein R2910_10320 [Gemmatimonadales bacterium]